MRVALAQIDVPSLDLAVTCEAYRRWTSEARQRGCDCLVFPELSDTGFALEGIEGVTHPWGRYEPLLALQQAARASRLAIVAGICERTDEAIYDSLVFVGPDGGIAGRYRKIQLYGPLGEERSFRPGPAPVVAEAGAFKAGFMICNDIRFPEVARSLALMGAELAFVVSAWPFPRVGHWEVLLRARAIENQMYVVAVNRVGRAGPLTFCGRSMVVDPQGQTVASGNEEKEGLIVCEIEPELVTEVRNRFPGIGARRPEAYRLNGGGA